MENKESEFRDHQEKLFLIANALIIGTLTGFVISVFRLAIEKIFDLITKIFTNFNQSPIPVLLLIIFSVLALSGCGFLIHRYPYLSGSGIPQIEGQLKGVYHEKAIGTLIGKFFGGIIAIGSGLMLGREGPSVQIGGSIGQITSSFYHQKEDRHLKIFIACGAAAGLSAAFTAPLASVIFVAEEIYHRFIPVVWISAFVSSMAASFVTLNIFGLQPVLKIHYISVLQLKYYPWIIIIGILIGLLCRLYQILLLKMPLLMSYTKLPDYFFGPFVYILMIPLALFLPYCIGGGNQLITFVGKNSINIWFLGLIILIRFLYSLLSYATKLPGGIFLPSLTLGALIGAWSANILINIGVLPINYLPNMVILGMVGFFAGVTKAPFTAILLVSEMVGGTSQVLSLLIVAITSYLVVDELSGKPIYEDLLEQLVRPQNQS